MTQPFRYKCLGYAALNVTNLERSADFYENVVGLDYVETGDDGEIFFRCSDNHHDIVLYQNDTYGLKRIGWEIENGENLEKAYDHVKKLGLNPVELSEEEKIKLRLMGGAFRFREPTIGVEFEFYESVMQMSDGPFQQRLARIQRIGHVVLQVPDIAASKEFLTEKLNFAISDSIGRGFYALRCWPNPYHHSLAISAGTKSQLNHVNFMCEDIDDIGEGWRRLEKQQIKIVNGPGHHTPSGSFFLYWPDPDGMKVEYSAGMEKFDEVNPRKPRFLQPGPRGADIWGGGRSADYKESGVIEGAEEYLARAEAAE